MPTRSFVTFIDDATRKVWAYPMAHKSDAFNVFQKWLALVENQLDGSLNACGLIMVENMSLMSFSIFVTRGIKRELTTPHIPTQNGVAERLNRTI